MFSQEIHKGTFRSVGMLSFFGGGQILYYVLSKVFYYHSQSNIIQLLTVLSFILLAAGSWMLIQRIGDENLNSNIVLRVAKSAFGILSLSFGAMLLLTPLFGMALPYPPSTSNKYPEISIEYIGGLGWIFLGGAIWLFAHSRKSEVKQTAS